MKKVQKTQFVSGKIRDVTSIEKVGLSVVDLILLNKIERGIIAVVPGFLSEDGKGRPLIFSRKIARKIIRDHGKFVSENVVINANDWDGALVQVRSYVKGILQRPTSKKINLIKKIPNSRNFLLIAAETQNGFFILTHFETVASTSDKLKSLLGRGDLLGPTGTPLGPADFLVAPSPKALLRGVSGSGDLNNIPKIRR